MNWIFTVWIFIMVRVKRITYPNQILIDKYEIVRATIISTLFNKLSYHPL